MWRKKPLSAKTCVSAALLLLLGTAPAARASEPLSDFNVRNPTLKVNAKGEALVEYTTTKRVRRHVLVWGGINAVAPPSTTVRQVRFSYDFAGGWGRSSRLRVL